MFTTLNKIRKFSPCNERWEVLLKNLGKTKPDNEPLSMLEILNSNGLEDTLWAWRAFDKQDWMGLYLADIAEHVLPVYESRYPEDRRPRMAVDGIRAFVQGKIDRDELHRLAANAYDAAYESAGNASAYTASYAVSYTSSYSSAYAASYSYYAARYAVDAAAYNAIDSAEGKVSEQDWQEQRLREYLESEG